MSCEVEISLSSSAQKTLPLPGNGTLGKRICPFLYVVFIRILNFSENKDGPDLRVGFQKLIGEFLEALTTTI